MIPIVILRKMRIKKDPLSLISDSDITEYDDFEYDEYIPELQCCSDHYDERSIDGYEVNLMYDSIIEKRLLDAQFIGDRQPGEVGYLISNKISNGVEYRCVFSDTLDPDELLLVDEATNLLMNYYDLDFKQIRLVSPRNFDIIHSLIVKANRDKKVKQILR